MYGVNQAPEFDQFHFDESGRDVVLETPCSRADVLSVPFGSHVFYENELVIGQFHLEPPHGPSGDKLNGVVRTGGGSDWDRGGGLWGHDANRMGRPTRLSQRRMVSRDTG